MPPLLSGAACEQLKSYPELGASTGFPLLLLIRSSSRKPNPPHSRNQICSQTITMPITITIPISTANNNNNNNIPPPHPLLLAQTKPSSFTESDHFCENYDNTDENANNNNNNNNNNNPPPPHPLLLAQTKPSLFTESE